jgi:hypothetical protein
MTFSYDKKTQQSYNNILEERTYRTAQPKVVFPETDKCLTLQKRVTYHHHEDVGNFHFVCSPNIIRLTSFLGRRSSDGTIIVYSVILLTLETSSTDFDKPPRPRLWNAQSYELVPSS